MRARVRREKETVVRGAICCKIQRSIVNGDDEIEQVEACHARGGVVNIVILVKTLLLIYEMR